MTFRARLERTIAALEADATRSTIPAGSLLRRAEVLRHWLRNGSQNLTVHDLQLVRSELADEIREADQARAADLRALDGELLVAMHRAGP